ncbi:FAD/NAD(P)-binding protein [unidentified bacterial endosymbiont]|uniref:FAD/NAD(P)-binding protein n=1 Tax=unidentified bacterial endosymbiont TaxID=2355 RepID=UPI00209F8BDF|nr:FAD/NAD(P)-binding protein [unidentified bacterial endosymbiont]
MDNVVVAIVGGGPRAVYALERLLALLTNCPPVRQLSIHIFDNTGRFGAGMAHSDRQSKSCYLNRPVDQIAFAADESVSMANALLPASLRLNFYHWCRQRFYATGDARFDLQPHDMPHRYLHGLALRDYFDTYADALRALPGITVTTHAEEVTRVTRDPPAFLLHTPGLPAGLRADYALFVTGHTPCRAHWQTAEARYQRGLTYTSYAYPLDQLDSVDAGSRIALSGMGLTAIDICLHLTEGRGGRFVRTARGPLRYQASGHEPVQIIALSRSGQLYTARARNQKTADDLHRPHFFSEQAIASLRRHRGRSTVLRDGNVCRQLDFRQDVFPLIVLEMAWIYYRTLFGERFAQNVSAALAPHYQAFLTHTGPDVRYDVDTLMALWGDHFRQMAHALSLARQGTVHSGQAVQEAAAAYVCTLTDESVTPEQAIERLRALTREEIKWRHAQNIYHHQFDWQAIFYPSARRQRPGKAEQLDALARDLAFAAQGNLSNPLKAACDGVWRDLRPVFSAATDFGGLTPASQQDFIRHWLSHYNRLSNGAGTEAMEKLGCLIACGRVTIAPGGTRVRACGPLRGYRLAGRHYQQRVDHLCCARLHPFDARRQRNPLYPSLLAAGLARLWENRGADGTRFIPGALDLTRDFHPVDDQNHFERRLTFLGAPAEGLCFFQNAAARPDTNSAILSAVNNWATDLLAQMAESTQPVTETERL